MLWTSSMMSTRTWVSRIIRSAASCRLETRSDSMCGNPISSRIAPKNRGSSGPAGIWTRRTGTCAAPLFRLACRRCWMGTTELLYDHRLAVVGRADQEQIRHTRALGEIQQVIHGGERRLGAGIAHPTIGADAPDPDSAPSSAILRMLACRCG